ncbi:uncharacterized protein ISCGN_011399 [Ixodes scapularis]
MLCAELRRQDQSDLARAAHQQADTECVASSAAPAGPSTPQPQGLQVPRQISEFAVSHVMGGHGGIAKMTVVNTFVFIAQVLLLLPPHWAGDAVKSCPAAIHRAERIITADNKETATHTDRNFLRWTFNENLEFSRFTSPSTSATSAPALPSIKDHPRSALHCGHGGIAKMTVVNTFVFIAQVLLLLPPHWAGDAVKSCPAAIHRAEHIITADNKETATHTDRNFLRWTFNENLEFSRFTSPSTSATSAPALPSIKDHPRSALHCGHGGIAKMTVVNTFVFIAQTQTQFARLPQRLASLVSPYHGGSYCCIRLPWRLGGGVAAVRYNKKR